MQTERSRPGDDSGAATMVRRTETEHTASARQLPLARAAVFGPSGRRMRFLALVSCPHCGRVHAHYGASVADLLAAVRSGCGRPYRLAALILDGEGGGRRG